MKAYFLSLFFLAVNSLLLADPVLPTSDKLADRGSNRLSIEFLGINKFHPSDISGSSTLREGFRIGKYPITTAQYCVFLNAVAKEDPYHLYNEQMALDPTVASIVRSGEPGNYEYTILEDENYNRADLPVVYVTWINAARFCNWMQHDQPTGSEDSNTTEDGAYTLPSDTVSPIRANADAKYFLPTKEQWDQAYSYKASESLGQACEEHFRYTGITHNIPYPPTPLQLRVLLPTRSFIKGNISEWTGSTNSNEPVYVIKGTSFTEDGLFDESIETEADLSAASNSLGFRIATPPNSLDEIPTYAEDDYIPPINWKPYLQVHSVGDAARVGVIFLLLGLLGTALSYLIELKLAATIAGTILGPLLRAFGKVNNLSTIELVSLFFLLYPLMLFITSMIAASVFSAAVASDSAAYLWHIERGLPANLIAQLSEITTFSGATLPQILGTGLKWAWMGFTELVVVSTVGFFFGMF